MRQIGQNLIGLTLAEKEKEKALDPNPLKEEGARTVLGELPLHYFQAEESESEEKREEVLEDLLEDFNQNLQEDSFTP